MEIEYQFSFESGQVETFNLRFDDQSMQLQPESMKGEPDGWMELGFHQCPGCPLPDEAGALCPVARNLGSIVNRFSDSFSYEPVKTVVSYRERQVCKEGDLQNALSSMMGLVMATSGCPRLDMLRPMAYTHQPFATLEETLFRAISSYLVAQYMRVKHGATPTFDLDGLKQIYSDINQVNHSLDQRLRHFKSKDANLNALVLLDIFAQMGAFTIDDDLLNEISPVFKHYLEEDAG